MERESYIIPEMEFICFETADVITTSNITIEEGETTP